MTVSQQINICLFTNKHGLFKSIANQKYPSLQTFYFCIRPETTSNIHDMWTLVHTNCLNSFSYLLYCFTTYNQVPNQCTLFIVSLVSIVYVIWKYISSLILNDWMLYHCNQINYITNCGSILFIASTLSFDCLQQCAFFHKEIC